MAVGWIKNSADNSGTKEIWVYDDIGFWGTNADDFRRELASVGDGPLLVRINSGGGDPFDAVAIANLLSLRGNVTTQVDGLAASAASVILMGGATRKMAANAWVMIHNPSIMVAGQEADLALAIRRLATVRSSLIDTYSKRTGKTKDEVGAWMDEETWFSGDQAKSANVVDAVTETMQFSASIDPTRFKHLPEEIRAIHRGRETSQIEANASPNHAMSVIADFLANFKAAPSERETQLVELVEALDVKSDELIAAKDPKALRLIVDSAVTAATADATAKLTKITADIKEAGFDTTEGLKAAIDARVETLAAQKALTATASRGIKPVPTTDEAAKGTAATTATTLKGRERVAAAIAAELGKKNPNN